MRAENAADTVRAMVAVLGEDFQGDAVRVVLFNAVEGLTPDWLQVLPARDKRMVPFKDALENGEPICGRLNPDKLPLLFGDDAKNSASVALIPMPGTGLIAIGSADGNRLLPGHGHAVPAPDGRNLRCRDAALRKIGSDSLSRSER
jgi:uncharacterized protein YigA (DUF484 family)